MSQGWLRKLHIELHIEFRAIKVYVLCRPPQGAVLKPKNLNERVACCDSIFPFEVILDEQRNWSNGILSCVVLGVAGWHVVFV